MLRIKLADLLQPVAGWQGPAPRTEGQLIDAAVAEKRGRERAARGNREDRGGAQVTAPVIWSASRDGPEIYRGGELVAQIPFSAFCRLIYDLAKALR